MEPLTSMRDARDDLFDLIARPDRRPAFCAEAMSWRFRIGILVLAMLAGALLVATVGAMAAYPYGVVSVHELSGVLMVGATLVSAFLVMSIYGALAANNPRLSTAGRLAWFLLFALAGPIAVACYWLIHVRRAPLESAHR